MTLQFGHKEWFIFIISILIITDLTILLNVPFFRQIFGFIFLTILPGLLILQILKLNKIGFTEKIVLSVGLSISFLMLFGLLINNSSFSLGYETPLSTISLLISFNIVFIILATIGYKLNKNTFFSLPNLNLTTSEKAFLIVPVIFPALSILGTHFMKTTDNNIILLCLLFIIPIYVIFVCLFNHKFPNRLYPVVIFSISISLLLVYMLRFPHICGHDVHTEYYLFQMALNNLHWSIVEHSLYDTCLCISLLPTIFQSILNINAQEYLFKGVYVSVCSFAPLAIYVLSKRYIDELYAFLASFFFMSQSMFLVVAGSPRTHVAIFFIALAVMVFFNDKIEPLKRRILFIIFMLSVVVSHYSTTYIFFFVLLFSWLVIEIFSRRYVFKRNITLTAVLLFFASIFFWYSQVTETAFNSGVAFVEETFLNLNKFFIEESRAELVTKQLFGQELVYPILSRANWVVTWCTFILIGIGVLTMLKKYKEMVAISNVKLKKSDFLKEKFEMEYLVMTLMCTGFLVVMLTLPHVSIGYSLQRLYSLALIILSVCFVIGGITVAKQTFKKHFLSKERTCAKKETLFAKQKAFMEKCYRSSFGKAFLFKKRFVLKEKNNNFFGRAFFSKERFKGKNALENPVRKRVNGGESSQVRAYLIILLILIPYFLFQTGAMYQIFGATGSITLNSEGKGYDREYVHDSESRAAKWLAMNGEEDLPVSTTDYYGRMRLISQGKISPRLITPSFFSRHHRRSGEYIYLYNTNVVKEKLVVEGVTCNMSEYSDMLIGRSKVYNSGCAEVYKCTK